MRSTPDTADAEAADLGEPPGTTEAWLGLLSHLSDDELARYGEIARDQRRLEWRHAWAQGLCFVAAIGVAAWAVARMVTDGLSRQALLALGLAAALGYWPYRKAKVRRLWGGHCRAVAAEQARRRSERAGAADATRT
ncbi:MAG: hypothetical protein R3D27_02865 [Hyphomicrobiaceae bacterium]